MDAFGVSVNQASKDLNRYIAMAPDNMAYDKSSRTYIRSSGFAARFLEPDASFYLSKLRSVADGIVDRSDTWIGKFPSYDCAPTPVRGVDPKTLRSVVAAIRRSEAIEIKYQSMSRPEPSWRWIAPHAIGFDGYRWHARAFCLSDDSFKDFLFSRILETRNTKASPTRGEEDIAWNEELTLEIGPHPDLSDAQKKVIALDYGMRGGRAEIRVRKALLYYALKRLGLDTDPSARRPQDQQIVLLNSDAVLPVARSRAQ
ncbi:MAG: WYL domain-containing protein [Porphyrobacter sp. IPPAS B-1204]|nr:MAG: WYL domain-containing protein [Porphyrobacter sp. IPPAS B-1204]